MKLLRFVIRFVAIAIGIGMLGFFALEKMTDISPDDAKKAVVSYSRQCGTSLDEAERIFGELAARAAQGPVEEVKAMLLSEYKVRSGQGSFSDKVSALQFSIEQAVGYDPEKRIRQVAMSGGIQGLKEDSEKCRLVAKEASFPQLTANNAKAPEPLPTAQSGGVMIAESENKNNQDQYLQDVARQATEAYAAKWREIQANPEAFFNKCVAEDADVAIRLGGMAERAAKDKAKATCSAQLTSLKSCMDRPSAKAANCFQDVFESGN